MVLIVLGVSIYTVRKRNIKVPGLETVRGLMNPGYQKMDKDIGMVDNNTIILRVYHLSKV